ncbi:MAG: HipA domain-containing protein [Balneolaceae bacterium]
MKRCPITYNRISSGWYSKTGLHYLNPALEELKPLPLDHDKQLIVADGLMARLSLPGSSPKLNAQLSVTNRSFKITGGHASYILKPKRRFNGEMPQNEDVTMKMASACGIEVPLHGLIYAEDQTMLFMVRRFDRTGRSGKIHTEDLAQISGKTRQTKYDSSMEEVARILDRYCTFPLVEKMKLFRRTLFSYMTGNGDMHLKNLSIIHRKGKVELSPAYDLINTALSEQDKSHEMALSLTGKRSDFVREDFFETFARKILGLHEKAVDSLADKFRRSLPEWRRLLKISFLSEEKQEDYRRVLDRRLKTFR